jgi:hypothetical protein
MQHASKKEIQKVCGHFSRSMAFSMLLLLPYPKKKGMSKPLAALSKTSG